MSNNSSDSEDDDEDLIEEVGNGDTNLSHSSVITNSHTPERARKIQSPGLSINIQKTLAVDDDFDEPPAIVQLPDLSTAPSLRGRVYVEGNSHKCEGVWAMNDQSHSIPGQTSDFEFRLVFPGAAPSTIPVDGRYTGWFLIKNPQKSSNTKIEDKDLDLKFVKKENSNDYEVSGAGVNKFGKFTVQGILKSNNMMQLYKIYQPKRVAGATPRGAGSSPRPRTSLPARPLSTTSVSVASPRESGRMRKPSLALTESFVPPPPPLEKVSSNAVHQKPVVQRTSSKQVAKAISIDSATPRTSRAPPFVNKCKDVLKEMSKQVSAIYFLEAVDHVKLGIPDYPTIIKEPMDFGTIRVNLENQLYKSHEMFADHMRLVFKNAITYNVRRDNPVHIAARELADLFEDRYRIMVTQISAHAYANMELEPPPPVARSQSSNAGRKSTGKGRGRGSHGVPGPRALETRVAPPALDSSMQQMMLMHQKMLDMEQELNSLRTAVRQTEIRTSLDQQRVAAQIPLSFDEKATLVNNIQRLDGEQINAVVDIIQSAMPHIDCGGDSDELEIPMDELDTYTLRQLQDYVHTVQQQNINAKRKRQSIAATPAPTPAKSPRGGKKAKSTAASQYAHHDEPPPVLSAVSYTAEEFSVQVRQRTDSLDLFACDEMEEERVVTAPNNFDTWKNGGVDSKDVEEVSKGSWGEAVSERRDTMHRETELQAEADKLAEQRAKVESDRLSALQRAYDEQARRNSQLQGELESEVPPERDTESMSRDALYESMEL